MYTFLPATCTGVIARSKLNCVPEVTLKLHDIPGGKELFYTQIDMPLTAIDDFAELGKTDPMFAELAKIVE